MSTLWARGTRGVSNLNPNPNPNPNPSPNPNPNPNPNPVVYLPEKVKVSELLAKLRQVS